MATAYRFGNFLLNTHEQTLFLDDEPVRLRAKEFEILQLLVLNNGKVLSKDEMMSAVWQDTFVEESNLAQYISRLRKVLNVDGNQYITTHPKRGYRFLADLQTGRNAHVVERSMRVSLDENGNGAEPRSLKDIGRLAVLPFQALGSRPDEEFLGLGIADALITQLTRTGQIVVSPTVSVKKFADRDVDAIEIADELNVDAVLQGNFQKAGDKIRLTLQMLEASTGRALWAESFNSEFDDIFAVQDRIAELIVRAFSEQLSIEISSGEASTFTRNTDAYNEYLKGRVHFSKRTDEGLSNALTHFKRAIEFDPQFALAYTGIADVYQLMPLSDDLSPHSAFPKAKAAVLKALEIDDTIAEAHLSLAVCLMNYDWNFNGAELSFLKAIKLNPNLAQARMVYGTLLMRLGRLSDAIIELNHARSLDPLSPSINTWMAEALSDLGQHEAAIRIHSETLRFAPEYSLAHYYLSLAYLNSGRIDEAAAAVDAALKTSDDVSLMRSARVMVHAMRGNYDEARRELNALIEKRQRTYVSATNIASGYAGLKERDKVFEWLETAIEDRDSHLTWLNVDFEFEYLHSDPRFQNILRRVNLLESAGEREVASEVIEAGSYDSGKTRPIVKWKVAALGGVAVLVLLGGAYFLIQGIGSKASATNEKNTLIRLTESPMDEMNPTFTRDGRVRFGRLIDKKTAINMVMNPDGTDQREETPIAGMSFGTWSPDGTKVFFHKAGVDGKYFLANADGSDERVMPFSPGNAGWSPDSNRFIYQARGADTSTPNNSDIFIYTLETGAIEPVVETPFFDSDPIFSPDGKSILFASDRDGNFEIYTMVLATGEIKRLTDDPAHESFPTYSPDGTQIIFNSDREKENNDVYLMNADGSNVRKITDGTGWDAAPPNSWSPDGTQVLLMSDRGGKENIYVMNIEPYAPRSLFEIESATATPASYSPDGRQIAYFISTDEHKGEIRLREIETGTTKVITALTVDGTDPLFSPDGSRILFHDRLDGNTDVWTIGVDGTDRINLSDSKSTDMLPGWSPDGRKIAFSSNRGGALQLFQVYVMNSDGSDQRLVFGDRAMSVGVTWSPDGRQLVFANDREGGRIGNFELFSINADGGPETRLTDRPRYDANPAFSPDGKRIAFVSNTDGNAEIYLMNADGTGLLRLTRDRGRDVNPRWSPDGEKIIFTSDRSGKYAVYEILMGDLPN